MSSIPDTPAGDSVRSIIECPQCGHVYSLYGHGLKKNACNAGKVCINVSTTWAWKGLYGLRNQVGTQNMYILKIHTCVYTRMKTSLEEFCPYKLNAWPCFTNQIH